MSGYGKCLSVMKMCFSQEFGLCAMICCFSNFFALGFGKLLIYRATFMCWDGFFRKSSSSEGARWPVSMFC